MLFYHPLFKVILLRRNISHLILNSIGANLSIVQLSNIFQKPESEGCRKIIQNEKYFMELDQEDEGPAEAPPGAEEEEEEEEEEDEEEEEEEE